MTKIYEILASIARENGELAGECTEFAAADQLRSWTDSAVQDCLAAPEKRQARKVNQRHLLQSVAEEQQTAEITSAPPCALQGRMPTTNEGMITTLFMTMMQWNFSVDDAPCCMYHGAVLTCIRLCEQLRAGPCRIGMMHVGEVQCMTCGLLLARDEQCAVCS